MARLTSYALLFALTLSKLATASPLVLRRQTGVPSNVANGTTTAGCTEFHTVAPAETCLTLEQDFDITDAELHALNPEINSDCTNLIAGEAYCVQSSNSTGGNPVTVPSNVAPGTNTAGCTLYHTVVPDETCNSVAQEFGITFATFQSLNPEIDNTCTDLIVGEAYCVQTSNGTALPPPPSNLAPGTITAGCTRYSTISQGESCTTVEETFGISSAFFTAANPEINAECTNLFAGLAYCVGGIAGGEIAA